MRAEIIQQIQHNRLLDMRRLDRLIQSDDFKIIWSKCHRLQKLDILYYIRYIKPDDLKTLIDRINLPEISIASLRVLASSLHIKNYSRKSRLQLVREILTAQEKLNNKERLNGSK